MNRPVDIAPNHLDVVLGILYKHLPAGVKVWVFGSRADWTTRDSSDLDLALEDDSALDYDTIMSLETAFEESSLPYKVDVVDLNRVSDSFKRIVDAQKVILPVAENASVIEYNWHMASLGNLVDLRISGVDKKAKVGELPVRLCNYTDVYNNSFINTDMDFMTATATEREISKCLLLDGDVIITKDSEKHDDIGVPALVRGDVSDLVCSYHLAILRPTSKIDGSYLYYTLNTEEARHQFQSYANGITRFGLRKGDIGLVEIPLPPLDEQRQIAHILRTLDDKIELNRRMNQTLENMARALFKSWFVDFDPVRAKMDGIWQPGKSLPGFPAHFYNIFPDRLVDFEHGEIPEGWTIEPIGSVVELYDSIRVPLNSRQRAQRQGHYPYYGAAGIMDYVDDFLFQGIHVLVGEVGSVVDVNNHPVLQYVWGQFWVNNHAHVIKGKNGISDEYIYLILQHQNVKPFITGAVQPKLNQKNMKAMPVVLPSQSIRHTFSSLIRPLFASLRINAEESFTLIAQRDALLPKLMSGDLRVGTTKELSRNVA